MAIERTTDCTEALPGADCVIMAVTVRRYPLWEQDCRIPMALGFRSMSRGVVIRPPSGQ